MTGILFIADSQEIIDGKITDVYFERTREILVAKGIDKEAKVEIRVKSFPENCAWGILSGIEEVVELLKNKNVTVEAMAEGTVFYPNEPVLTIQGRYLDFAILETAILGCLCQASGIATKAARCKMAAGNKPVISFGARRMHPAIAPMIERSAFVGGCDGVAVIKSAELIGEEPMGTMPHALILIMGDTVTALRAFDEIINPEVKRVALIDTFNDEKFEAIRVAEALGSKLFAVRVDTPASRKGNLRNILSEIRWELDYRNFQDVKILVSGGLDEYQIPPLNDFADAYGVGTSISNAPVINFALDIIEIEGKPIAKRGKESGSKRVLRCSNCLKDKVIPFHTKLIDCECGGKYSDLLKVIIDRGKLNIQLPPPQRIRNFTLSQLSLLNKNEF